MKKFGIDDVLRNIRKESSTEVAKGTAFEKLMQRWFQTEPLYNYLAKVWLWSEFPSKNDFGSGHDLGIDLVAKTDTGEYWAIQCKCYAESATIDKGCVDSFLSTSSREFNDEDGLTKVRFSRRIWVSTTEKLGPNAEATLKNQHPECSRISLYDLRNSHVDWEKLANGEKGKNALGKGKQLRPHQLEAISKAEEYYKDHDRGKLIMACGTGKTFTSLRLVEQLVGGRGLVLFMVPSIGLLGQSLNDWAADAKDYIRAVCVCSDGTASQKSRRNSDADDMGGSVEELAQPATTDVDKIRRQLIGYRQHKGLVVVFSTYQSIDVVSEAQRAILRETHGEYGVFDFIVCDEAHRTTGVKLSDRDESNFTKIHSNDAVQGKKRLYMTATPRLYGASAKVKARENNCLLCSMDDESIYGKEFFRVNFAYAVQNGILTDYKVLVLTVEERMLPDSILGEIRGAHRSELNYDDTGRLIGVISGLSKQVLGDNGATWDADPKLMRRALAFTHRIGARNQPGTSKNIEVTMPLISEMYNKNITDEMRKKVVNIKTRHVDGSMGATARNEALSWLSGETQDPNECRVLTNVRCLSEGIDVPALDAVIFLSPRNSQVDVVQSVGRVMRSFGKGTDGEKKYGYIIIPIVVPEKTKPEDALNDNKTFSMLWDILNALRAHDDHFNALVNTIALNEDPGTKIIIGGAGVAQWTIGHGHGGWAGELGEPDEPAAMRLSSDEATRQLQLRFGELNGAIFAKLVEHCGDRTYWEKWGKEVGAIARKYIERITRIVRDDEEGKRNFAEFTSMLRKNINPSISDEQCIEMLAQHTVTLPVFKALFGDYRFISNNTITKSMQFMLDFIKVSAADRENETLEGFYESVCDNVGKIDNLAGKQTIIKTLYERFFKEAFPNTVNTMGIVYTPVECVDFIIRSVDRILQADFGTALTRENVHIIDPFVGTGTFITRLLQSGAIRPEDMLRKYRHEIHCNEIVLLAYYIAAINIESVFHSLQGSQEHEEFRGVCLTDTFQLGELGEGEGPGKYCKTLFEENARFVEQQRETPIRVIIGNPPYSIGQRSANDNAQNMHYPRLEKRIRDTYALRSSATNRNSLYDSYIKAFRWATDRIDQRNGGVVAFISNGSWLDGNAQDGFRASLAEDFDKIYAFNLRGNQRTSGELSRREGGKIFGSASRTPVAITLLVRYPEGRRRGDCQIFYHDIGDYLTREEKLRIVDRACGIEGIPWQTLTPNAKHDWLNRRDGVFDSLLPLAPEQKLSANSKSFFTICSNGIKTNRDAFLYNSSSEALARNVRQMVDYYNSERERLQAGLSDDVSIDPSKIVWGDKFREAARKNKILACNEDCITEALYRPFCRQRFCYQKEFIERTYQQTKLAPAPGVSNLQICVSGIGVTKDFTCLITDQVPDLELVGKSQCFPLYWYSDTESGQASLFARGDGGRWMRHSGITDWALGEIRRRLYALPHISKEDIFYYVYGLLHSPGYRSRFAADLRKGLPRIPVVERPDDFLAFSRAGRQLAELHLGYETAEPPGDVDVRLRPQMLDDGDCDPYDYYRVCGKMRFAQRGDKTCIVYNRNVTVSRIPPRAYDYVVNGRSAVEWVMERYQERTDKASGIRNDCNDWARETKRPRYALDLLLSVISVSLRTLDIVDSLPALDIPRAEEPGD